MNSVRIVKRFFFIYEIFFIFFLTGCASGRYDNFASDSMAMPGLKPFRAEPNFDWPLNGKVAYAFGAKEEGVALKGMVIQGVEGQEVRAAETGQVVFTDFGLRGYGKTIIIDHEQGYSTVYARNAQVLVRNGDWVRKGQMIARVGQDGKGSFPQVYFELRHHSRPLDPQKIVG